MLKREGGHNERIRILSSDLLNWADEEGCREIWSILPNAVCGDAV